MGLSEINKGFLIANLGFPGKTPLSADKVGLFIKLTLSHDIIWPGFLSDKVGFSEKNPHYPQMK